MWARVRINRLSGTPLLVAEATTKLTNRVFYTKMACIVFAVMSMVLIRRRDFGAAADRAAVAAPARALAAMSLVLWAGAITAGRLMAYFGPVSGAPGLQNRLP